jgi:hypothetical protein
MRTNVTNLLLKVASRSLDSHNFDASEWKNILYLGEEMWVRHWLSTLLK